MKVKTEIGEKERIYTVDRSQMPLGSGATAIVYKGVDEGAEENDPWRHAAIKIARTGSTERDLAKFNRELEILNELNASLSVPQAAAGEALTNDDIPIANLKDHIIVLEFISSKYELRRAGDDAARQLPLEIAVPSALQYARLLQAMHQRNIFSRGDRKATDLRWLDADKRLVVLDWNRAEILPDKVKDAAARQDIAVFGRLWAEHLLARNVTSLPDIDDDSDTRWAELPRALRQILKQSLDSRPAWGYQQASEIVADLELYQDDAERSLEQLIRSAIEARGEGGKDLDRRIAMVERVLNLLDWAERHPDWQNDRFFSVKEAGGQTQISLSDLREKLHDWAKATFGFGPKTITEGLEIIKRQIKRGYYQEAARIISETQSRITVPANAGAILQLMRWDVVAQTGIAGNKAGQSMDEAIKLLQACVMYLEAADSEQNPQIALQNAQGQVQSLLENSNHTAASPLLYESKIRLHFLSPQDGGSPLVDPVECWSRIQRQHPWYARALRIHLSALDEAIEAEEEQQDRESEQEKLEKVFNEAFDTLKQELKQAVENLKQPGEDAPNLNILQRETIAKPLEAVHEAYKKLYLFSGEQPIGYESVLWLEDALEQLAQTYQDQNGGLVNASPLASFLSTFSSSSLPDSFPEIIDYCYQVARQTVTQLCKKNLWPHELKAGIELANHLLKSGNYQAALAGVDPQVELSDGRGQETGPSAPAGEESEAPDALSQVLGDLQKRQKRLEDLRTRLNYPQDSQLEEIEKWRKEIIDPESNYQAVASFPTEASGGRGQETDLSVLVDTPKDVQPDDPQPSDPDPQLDDTILVPLQEAVTAKIEIMERPFGEALEPLYRTQALLALRQLRQLDAWRQKLAEDLPALVEQLKNPLGELNEQKRSIDSIHKAVKNLGQRVQSGGNLYDALQEAAERVQSYVAAIEDFKEWDWASKRREINDLLPQENDIQELHSKVQGAKGIIAQVRKIGATATNAHLFTAQLQEQAQSAQEAMINIFVSAGIQAARSLNLEEAEKCLQQVQACLPPTDNADDNDAPPKGAAKGANENALKGADPRLAYLENAVEWLKGVQTAGHLDALRQLERALNQNNLQEAGKAVSALAKQEQEEKWLAHWIGREFQERYIWLQRSASTAQPGIAAVPPPGSADGGLTDDTPSPAVDEETTSDDSEKAVNLFFELLGLEESPQGELTVYDWSASYKDASVKTAPYTRKVKFDGQEIIVVDDPQQLPQWSEVAKQLDELSLTEQQKSDLQQWQEKWLQPRSSVLVESQNIVANKEGRHSFLRVVNSHKKLEHDDQKELTQLNKDISQLIEKYSSAGLSPPYWKVLYEFAKGINSALESVPLLRQRDENPVLMFGYYFAKLKRLQDEQKAEPPEQNRQQNTPPQREGRRGPSRPSSGAVSPSHPDSNSEPLPPYDGGNLLDRFLHRLKNPLGR